MTPETPSAPATPSAPVAPAVPASPAAPSTPESTTSLSEYEAHRVARGFMPEPKRPAGSPESEVRPAAEPEPVPATPANPLASAPEPAEEPEPAEAEPAKGPEAVAHKWKDPDTGVPLDLRRRDHRRIKKLLEERSEFARRLAQLPPQPRPDPQAPAQPVAQARPNDPRPTLEEFADQPDPYGAHGEAVAVWAARQEFNRQSTQRASVERTQRTQAAIESAQQAFDAKLPEIRTRYPDFDQAYDELHESLSHAPPKVRVAIVHRLLTSSVRHELAYYLGNHPEDLARLTTARTPHEQAIALGAIEAQVQHALRAEPVRTSTTRTPAPTSPVNTAGASARRSFDDIAKEGDYQAHRAARGMPLTGATAVR